MYSTIQFQSTSYRHRAVLFPNSHGKLPTAGEQVTDDINIYRVVKGDSCYGEVDFIGAKSPDDEPPVTCNVVEVIRFPTS